MTVTTDDRHTLAGAYSLDALDDVERREFEEHLRTCDACRAEVAGFAATAAYLGIAAAVSPPPGTARPGARRHPAGTSATATAQQRGAQPRRVPAQIHAGRRGRIGARCPRDGARVLAYQADRRADELAAEAAQSQQLAR
jgi:anti-sigma factor RsiW